MTKTTREERREKILLSASLDSRSDFKKFLPSQAFPAFSRRFPALQGSGFSGATVRTSIQDEYYNILYYILYNILLNDLKKSVRETADAEDSLCSKRFWTSKWHEDFDVQGLCLRWWTASGLGSSVLQLYSTRLGGAKLGAALSQRCSSFYRSMWFSTFRSSKVMIKAWSINVIKVY